MITGDDIFINGAKVIVPDLPADNGVVHVLDMVLSIPTNIEEVDAATNGIKVSPNPAVDYFNIEFPEPLVDAAQILLFDANGRLVKVAKTTDQLTQLGVNDLGNGVYFLRLDINDNRYYQKVIINK